MNAGEAASFIPVAVGRAFRLSRFPVELSSRLHPFPTFVCRPRCLALGKEPRRAPAWSPVSVGCRSLVPRLSAWRTWGRKELQCLEATHACEAKPVRQRGGDVSVRA